MATTPVTRVTGLARDYIVEIDTATYPASSYAQLMGNVDLRLIRELRTTSDEVNEDDGAEREEATGSNWRVEGKIKHSTNLAGTSRDATQAFLRQKFEAIHAGATVASQEFGVRIYHRDGLTGEAWEGRAYAKQWGTQGGTSQDEIDLVLKGQGVLAAITNPASSQVPAVTSVDPTTGAAAGGNLVMIYGDHFTAATDVDFGVTAATDFEVINDSTIAAIAPAVAASTVQVKVTTAAGASADTAADNYTYV